MNSIKVGDELRVITRNGYTQLYLEKNPFVKTVFFDELGAAPEGTSRYIFTAPTVPEPPVSTEPLLKPQTLSIKMYSYMESHVPEFKGGEIKYQIDVDSNDNVKFKLIETSKSYHRFIDSIQFTVYRDGRSITTLIITKDSGKASPVNKKLINRKGTVK